MQDKDGWRLSQKQAKQYLGAVKMLYGSPDKDPVGIVPPRANLEVLGLPLEKPSQERLCREGVGQAQLAIANGNVTRSPSNPKGRKEWREQEDIYRWTQTVQLLKGHVMMIGNEGRRTVVQSAVAKRMGLLSGASDLFIAKPVGIYHGLWVECKQNRKYTPSERSTDHWKRQEAFQDRMRAVGYKAAFAYGADDGIKIIQTYLDNV
jgi:hypothetical protein